MHTGTIAVYDEAARYWTDTRTAPDRGDDYSRPGAEQLRGLVEPGGRILDLGCGPGRMFAALGEPTIGLDASLAMLALAREDATVPVAAADVEHLPLASTSAVGAFANFSFQHLPTAAFSRALAEVARVLALGGYLQLAVHAGDYEGADRPGDDLPGRWFTMWTPERLHPEITRAGFTVLESRAERGAIRVTAQKS